MLAALRRGASPAPLLLLAFVLLPWIPLDLPAALVLWSGRLSLLVWLAVALCMAVPLLDRLRSPRRPRLVAGLTAFAIGATAFWQVSSQVPGGDEPHYLIITQSLLYDGDLRIENNHLERQYERYYGGLLLPDVRVRGRDGAIYSIHAPGVSALVAPAFAAGGYLGAVFFLLIVSALGAALAWHLAWLVTGRDDAAWFGWAAVTLSTTWVFHSFAVYPDVPGAVLVLTGVWALLRAGQEQHDRRGSILPWLWHGAALALLPWMHTRFAVLAGGLGALVLLRLPFVPNAFGKAMAFLAVPSVSLIAWLGYFISIYGTPDPTVPYGAETGGFQYVPDGLGGLLFDQGFGLLMYAPVLLFGFAGIAMMAAHRDHRRLALEHLFVLVPYLLIVTHFAMWWGGRSAPARFFVPVLLWMTIPAAVAWTRMVTRATRVSALGALAFTVFASAVLVCVRDGGLAFNDREAPALWLEWLNGTVDLARALPMWFRTREVPLFRGIALWSAAALVAWFALRWVDQQRWARHRSIFCTAAVLMFAAAGSLTAGLSWRIQNVSGHVTTPAQLDALRLLSNERRLLTARLFPAGSLDAAAAAASLRIEPAPSSAQCGGRRNDRPLYSIPALPAGEYRLRPLLRGTAGWMMVGVGCDQFAVRTEPLTAAQQPLVVSFPVELRALLIRVDEDARANIRGLALEPIALVPPERQLTSDFARHAVRYGAATVYFMDERSYAEPEAFWVGGSRTSDVVIHPDGPKAADTLLLRNGATENTVLVSTRGWREEMRLGPGEERRIQIPLDLARGATLFRISASSGFRPSEVDPHSQDHRFLGVWVRVGDK